ncbi:uncharacterized protein LOC125377686 [Haliotis rufescens]|uniref:uncharacterized protein LOC125377686 n=1 Tax=Haliotis rufescens TaxID=6454 RepID=UPI00201EEB73|nr:uncharacterized protein LOC125377686 [Haliotis rufescens]XP_048247563.1 uncharacterized protein LOC125377686 [Haliotis rufescens]
MTLVPLFVVLFHAVVTKAILDPCAIYKPFPDSDRRDPSYELGNGETSIDDNELKEGWYGDTNYTLVDESPGFYKCGGWYPIWINGSTSMRSSMCVQSPSDACSLPFEIDRQQCDGFSIYFLPQAPIHRAVYCLSSNVQELPVFNEIPQVTFDLLDKLYSSELLFRCNFTRANESLSYKTTWYLEGAPFYTFEPMEWNSDDFDYVANRTLTEEILRENGVAKAGFNLQCRVQALYGLDQASSSGGLSEVQFVGVKIWAWDNVLYEGETRTIYLHLTVPFRCGSFINDFGLPCWFDINVHRVQDPGECQSAAVVQNSCGINSINSSQWNQLISVTVVGKITSTYGENSATTQMKLKTPKTSFHLPFWEDYDIGIVTFQIVKNTTLYQSTWCSSSNDPYVQTFSWTYFYLDAAGIYTLYKNGDDIEVQIQTEECNMDEFWVGPYCTCGVAVRAGKTVFEISHCESLTWHIGYTACGDDGDVLQVRRDWNYYTISLPTGNIVDVSVTTYAPYFLNVYITSSVNDVEKNRGMCGSVSTTQNGDLIKRSGSLANSTDDFAESWRVTPDNNLFNPEVISNGFASYKPLFQYCTCERETDPLNPLTCTAMAATETCLEPDNVEDIKPKNCIISKRKKRMAQRSVKRIKRQSTSQKGWSNGWNLTLAQEYCDAQFSADQSVKVCGDVPGVNVADSINDCVKDIELSGTTDFVAMALEGVHVKCVREAMQNPVLKEAEAGETSIFEKITKDTCSHDCSGRGSCNDGQCHCNSGFGGGDCSVDFTNPPVLIDVGEGGKCDLAAGTCVEMAVLGDIFSGEEYSKCQVKKYVVTRDGKMLTPILATSKAVLESISEVICTTPEPGENDVVTAYNVSVSHDGHVYSNELSVLVYDSTCVNVNTDTMEWSLQASYCTHKGKCVHEGEPRGVDLCFICKRNDNGGYWENTHSDECVPIMDNGGTTWGGKVSVLMGLLVASTPVTIHYI